MAIFGKNGLYAAGITLVSLYFLYGKKNSGFADQQAIDNFKARRRPKGRTAAQLRSTQEGGAPEAMTAEFKESVAKKTYFR